MIRLEAEREFLFSGADDPVENGSPGNYAPVPETDRKIEQTIAYMKEHLDRPLKAAVLAAEANLSLSHYFALFKRRTGCAPIDFFTRLRMQQACRLLETTCLNVKQVAAVLGYDDQFYFSRVFKTIQGIAPSEYRTLPEDAKDRFRKGGLAVRGKSPNGDSQMANRARWSGSGVNDAGRELGNDADWGLRPDSHPGVVDLAGRSFGAQTSAVINRSPDNL